MGIEAASTTTSSTVSSSAQVSSASNSDNAKKTGTDSSFKDEMSKVSEEKDSKNQAEIEPEKNIAQTNPDKQQKDENKDNFQILNGAIDYTKLAAMEINNANTMLQNNIQEMMNTNNLQTEDINSLSLQATAKNQVSLTQDDAQFFINLTQDNDVSTQNVATLAQNMITNGADAVEVTKNAKISQTLLNAINTARETNQPLRIDFDQNVSVILRIGQDGALSARFIPGDKAVEQYLRNNIETLKATFNEKDLPYSDLSYSNSSKQQNEKRRNKQQQGEQ